MSTTKSTIPTKSFHSGDWDYATKRPVVDGKFEDPVTGELRAQESSSYAGPPAVDIIIMNMHEDYKGTYRSQRPFTVTAVLCHMMKIVKEEGLEIQSLNAMPYSVVLLLACEIPEREDGMKGFNWVADRISNGLYDEEEGILTSS
jgi:hypothetical protein